MEGLPVFYTTQKLLVFDYDGTLAGENGNIVPETIGAIKKIQLTGHKVAIIMGRVRLRNKLLAAIQPDAYAVCNGGVIRVGTNILRKQLLRTEVIQQIIHLIPNDAIFYLIGEGSIFINDLEADTVKEISRKGIVKHISQFSGQEVYSFQVEHPKCSSLRHELGDRFPELRITGGYPPHEAFLSVEVAADKGSALKLIADYLQIPLSQSVVFGNGENDIPMLEIAGLAVQVGDSYALKKLAHVTLKNSEESLPIWLHQWCENNHRELLDSKGV